MNKNEDEEKLEEKLDWQYRFWIGVGIISVVWAIVMMIHLFLAN